MEKFFTRSSNAALWTRRGVAALFILVGGFLAVGGVRLLLLGGSAYYVLTGIAVLGSGTLILRGDRRGVWLYVAMLIATLAWSLWEVGFNAWALMPRLVGPLVLSVLLLTPPFRAAEEPGAGVERRRQMIALGSTLAAVLIGIGLHAVTPKPADPLFQAGIQHEFPEAITTAKIAGNPGDWMHWGNDQAGTRFSPLDQLTPETVRDLKPAWTADIGPVPNGKFGSFEATPLKIGDTLYLCTPYNTVLALDAETGERRWTYQAEGAQGPHTCRGVAYYQASELAGACAQRIIWVDAASNLTALDTATGELCADFGENGRTSLLTGLGEVLPGYYSVSSAPQIVRGKIVVGGAVLDGQFWGEPSGVIRGYDAVTGQFTWAYDVGRPDDHTEPVGDEHYTLSTPNSWAPISADETLGLVYMPTGNAVPDYYGAQRRPFDEYLTSSVVAIDAETGALSWRFQTVRHDLWDYDVGSQPTLVDLPVDGETVPALIQATKRGDVFVLDRRTGEPIFPVTDLQVPQGPIAPGERLSPTQPFSLAMPSFRGPDLREADMWGVTPLDQMMCRIKFKNARYEGVFTPPQEKRPNLVNPGYLGGSDWGGVAVDLDRMVMIINSNRMPNYDQLIPREEARRRGMGIVGEDPHANPARGQAMENTPFAVNVQPFLSVLGTPCNAPPWGLLTAVDLRTGKVIWNRPFGTARDSGPLGIPMQLPIPVGLPNVGGGIVTRGGLVFIAAVQERTFRAFEIRTGREVWSARLPGGGQAVPMTYWSSESDRQFVVLAAGGHMPMGTKYSSKLVAYALPK